MITHELLHKLKNHGFLYRSHHHVWQLGTFLGSGGMGYVYKASTKDNPHMHYALKVGLVADLKHERDIYRTYLTPDAMRRAERTLGYKLYVPRLVDEGLLPEAGLCFIVTDLLSPSELTPPISDDAFMAAAKDIAGALAYLHKNNLYHGDIKSDNILYKKGHYYLTDFGLTQPVGLTPEERGARGYKLGGTLRFAGRNMHLSEKGPSVSADVDNLTLFLMELSGATLPWEADLDLTRVTEAKLKFFSNPKELLKQVDSEVKTRFLTELLQRANSVYREDHIASASRHRLRSLVVGDVITLAGVAYRVMDPAGDTRDAEPFLYDDRRDVFQSIYGKVLPPPQKKASVVWAKMYLVLQPERQTSAVDCAFCESFRKLKERLSTSTARKDVAAVQALDFLGLWGEGLNPGAYKAIRKSL